jgi:hypothetical protein
MDTNDYRRKIEQSVAKAQARPSRSASRMVKKDPHALLASKKTPPKARAEALGRATAAEDLDAIPQTALDRLRDSKESPAVRLAAIKLLLQKQFFSPVAAEWRPDFVDALRAAVRDRRVRPAALEVLSLFKDRATQELLLEGIRKSAKALVPLTEALRLLSTDVHADVVDAAKTVTDSPQLRRNKAAFVQAVRILAADPSSVGKLQEVMNNDAHPMDARRVAATALNHLSPDVLQRTQEPPHSPGPKRRVGSRRGGKRAAAKAPAKTTDALAKHLDTLRRVRG